MNLQCQGTPLFRKGLFSQMMFFLATLKILFPVLFFPLQYLFICNSLILSITASLFQASLHFFSSWKVLPLLPHLESLHWLNSTLHRVQKPYLNSGGARKYVLPLQHSSYVFCHILTLFHIKAIP